MVVTADGSTVSWNSASAEPFVAGALGPSDMVAAMQGMLADPVTGLQFSPQPYFSPAVERHIWLVLAVYGQPPANQADLATALVDVLHAIQQKKPSERTDIEQQTLHDLSVAIASTRRYDAIVSARANATQIAQLEGQLTQLRTNEAAQKQQADEAAARIVKGPLNMGLGSLFDAKSTTDMAYADATKKRLEETRAQIRQVNAQIDGLKVKVIESDADAMLNYLSTTGINRVLRAGWQG